jgi:AraC-like DNA-binding protein
LARIVGMAKSTLTKGFKAVFGETILDFSLGCRMRHAMALMRDQSYSVANASEAVGYAHPTSFTTAFRRHFGMRPIDVRRVKSREQGT